MRFVLRSLILIAAAFAAFLAYAGYFDRNPLIEVPAPAGRTTAPRHLAAVYFSGDIGYRVGLGRKTAERLAGAGIPVVAVNSLAYFRRHRTVADVTRLTSQAIRRAMKLGQANQVILIGHSLGADVLQAALVELPADLRSKVRGVILIVPTQALYLEISPAEMLDLGRPDGSVLPTLSRLTWTPLTCVYGEDEADSPCHALAMPNVSRVPLPGGHQLKWDAAAIHQAIMRAVNSDAAKITKISGPAQREAMPLTAIAGLPQIGRKKFHGG